MPRPQKFAVDYFPHYCQHKKTIFIMEERYGNDGYAFWFKLLEMLGSAKGHCIDLGDRTELEFLLAKTHVSEVTGAEMLDLLAKLSAIDAEAWGYKVVWCQNFVDGLAHVYQKRTQDLPSKPSLSDLKLQHNWVSDNGNTGSCVVSGAESTQRERGTKESIESKERTMHSPIENPIEQHTSEKTQKTISIFDHWNQHNLIQHRKLTDAIKRSISGSLANYSEDEVTQAIDNYAAILASPEHFFKYKWTLKDFLTRGLDKFSDWRVCDANYRGQNGNGKTGHNSRELPKRYTPTPNYDRTTEAEGSVGGFGIPSS